MRIMIDYFKKQKFFVFVLLIFLIPRLIGLGLDEWNVDAPRWQVRSDEFARSVVSGNLEDTYQSYHPGVTLMWLSGFSKYAFYRVFEAAYGYKVYIAPGYVYPEKFFFTAFVAKFPLVFVISLLLAFSINLMRRLNFEKKYLYLFALILSLEPYYLGITRFFHLTGLESAFVFASFISCYYYLAAEKSEKKYLIFSGVFLGFGALTKMSAIILAPYLLLVLAFYTVNFNKLENLKYAINALKNLTSKYMLILLACCFVFVAFFPAAWFMGPLNLIEKMKDTGIDNIAFKDGPHRSILQNKYLYYYEIFFIKSLGLTFISLLGGVYLLLKKSIKNEKLKNLLILSGLYVVYYFFVLSFPSKQMTRYTIIAYPFVLMISSYALYTFLTGLKKKWIYAIGAVLIMYYGLILQAVYPVFSSFHSDLVGEYLGYSKIGTIYNDGEHYLQVGQYLNEIGGNDTYNYALVLPSSNKDMSVANAFVGTTFVKSVQGDKKFRYIYIAPDYYSLDKVPAECEYVRGFGHRWPFKFDFLSLYKCPGN